MATQSSFHSLNQEMMSHSFLLKNPLLSRVSQNDSSAELANVIRQYIRLPEEIVSYLQGAANHFFIDHPIVVELTRNWKQEYGSVTGGVPHVELLKHRLWTDLEIDARQITSNVATKKFLDTVAVGMMQDAWFAMHVLDFEVDHRDFLQEAIVTTIQNEQDVESFVAGFRNVLGAMDAWWAGIGVSS